MKIINIFLPFIFAGNLFAQLPAVSSGSIRHIDNFQSKFVTARNVDVWLPAGYSPNKKYPVLYMHDGQALFDSALTWNKQAWNLDDVLSKLVMENKIQAVIVVAIWNGGKTRHPDYFPQKPYQYLSPIQQDTISAQLQRSGRSIGKFTPVSDNYLKFLVSELKPFIDKNYATYRDQKNTFIAGSSMGGLISMYAICEYPEVFAGAVCLSAHWPGIFSMVNNPIPDAFIGYMSKHLPNPNSHKIYFDYGDQTLDSLYPPIYTKVDAVMRAKGYSDKNWISKYFPGENHSEQAWNKRLNIPMLFLLKK